MDGIFSAGFYSRWFHLHCSCWGAPRNEQWKHNFQGYFNSANISNFGHGGCSVYLSCGIGTYQCQYQHPCLLYFFISKVRLEIFIGCNLQVATLRNGCMKQSENQISETPNFTSFDMANKECSAYLTSAIGDGCIYLWRRWGSRVEALVNENRNEKYRYFWGKMSFAVTCAVRHVNLPPFTCLGDDQTKRKKGAWVI